MTKNDLSPVHFFGRNLESVSEEGFRSARAYHFLPPAIVESAALIELSKIHRRLDATELPLYGLASKFKQRLTHFIVVSLAITGMAAVISMLILWPLILSLLQLARTQVPSKHFVATCP